MTDLPPLAPCQSNEKGIHRMEGVGLVASEGDNASLTWVCRYCGALRQVSGFGPLYVPGSKDDLPAADIAGLWETR